jgi:hypothetical protein
MTTHALRFARIATLLLSCAGAVAWAFYMYRAGCTADLKGGSWGDHQLALETEMIAFAYGLAACLMLGLFAALSTASGIGRRTVSFLSVGLLGLVLMLGGGFFVETEGIRACAPSSIQPKLP